MVNVVSMPKSNSEISYLMIQKSQGFNNLAIPAVSTHSSSLTFIREFFFEIPKSTHAIQKIHHSLFIIHYFYFFIP